MNDSERGGGKKKKENSKITLINNQDYFYSPNLSIDLRSINTFSRCCKWLQCMQILNSVLLLVFFCSSVPRLFLSSADRLQLQSHRRLPGPVPAAQGIRRPPGRHLGPQRHPDSARGARHRLCRYTAQLKGTRSSQNGLNPREVEMIRLPCPLS